MLVFLAVACCRILGRFDGSARTRESTSPGSFHYLCPHPSLTATFGSRIPVMHGLPSLPSPPHATHFDLSTSLSMVSISCKNPPISYRDSPTSCSSVAASCSTSERIPLCLGALFYTLLNSHTYNISKSGLMGRNNSVVHHFQQ